MAIMNFLTKELQAVAALSLAAGLRWKEIRSLRYKDITVTKEEITITIRGLSDNKSRAVKANKTFEPELRKVIEQKGIHGPEDLFINHKISKHLDIHYFRVDAAKALFKELELEGTLSKEEMLQKVAEFLDQ